MALPDSPENIGGSTFTGKQARITIERLHEKCKQLRNWGKWGDDDELGTLNYVTREDVVNAGKLTKTGKVISLALPFDTRGPAFGLRGRFNPIHLMSLGAREVPRQLT